MAFYLVWAKIFSDKKWLFLDLVCVKWFSNMNWLFLDLVCTKIFSYKNCFFLSLVCIYTKTLKIILHTPPGLGHSLPSAVSSWVGCLIKKVRTRVWRIYSNIRIFEYFLLNIFRIEYIRAFFQLWIYSYIHSRYFEPTEYIQIFEYF